MDEKTVAERLTESGWDALSMVVGRRWIPEVPQLECTRCGPSAAATQVLALGPGGALPEVFPIHECAARRRRRA